MPFYLVWDAEAAKTYNELKQKAKKSLENRKKVDKLKASKEEGLFKQVRKCVQFLKINPKHPGLQTHEYSTLVNPYNPNKKSLKHTPNKTPPQHIEYSGFMVRRESKSR